MKTPSEQEWLSSVRTALPEAFRVMVFAPHPDDEVFGCGGTLALLRDRGATVSVVIVSDGALGGDNGDHRLPSIREGESRRAAEILGTAAPTFWGLADRSLAYGEALIDRMAREILSADADTVFLPAPTEIHPDHQAVALAGAEAIRRLGGGRHAVFYEVGAPMPTPNLLLDIGAAQVRKQRAMECFVSQLSEQPYIERTSGLNVFRAYHLGARVEKAEAFRVAGAEDFGPGLGHWLAGAAAERRRLGFATFAEDLPLVSIIVRSMNLPCLDEALGSLALQTYANLEIVVVNAKGGHHSPVGERGGRLPLRLVNQGGEPLRRAAAANAGLSACGGTYLGFLDDDDVLDPDHLHHLVEAQQKAGGRAVVYSGVRCLHRNDPDAIVLHTFAEPEACFSKLVLGNFIPIHAPLFPAGLLQEGVRFDESMDDHEDWDFWLQLARRAPFVFVDRITATYYSGGTSGISFHDGDPELVSRGVRRLQAKWVGMLTPEELEAVSALYRSVKSEAQAAGQSLARARADIQERDSRIEALAAELAGTQLRLEALSAELRAIHSSHSWRLTSPVRRCGAHLRRLARKHA